MILGKRPTWRTILFYVFISIFYMFRASSCSSSGESIVSMQHLVYVTLFRWTFRVQVGKSATTPNLLRLFVVYNLILITLNIRSFKKDRREFREKLLEFEATSWSLTGIFVS
jgi:hypothetical protein